MAISQIAASDPVVAPSKPGQNGNQDRNYARSGGKPDPVDVHVGRRIRFRRLEIGWTQVKLADHLAVAFQQVQKYERGTNRVSAGSLQKIADAMGVSPAYFFPHRENADDAASDITPLLTNRAVLRLVRAFAAVTDPAMRTAILSMAEACAQETSNDSQVASPDANGSLRPPHTPSPRAGAASISQDRR